MAASTLTKTQQKFTVRAKIGKTKTKSKTVLLNPYDISWPPIEKDIQTLILEKIESTIKPLGIAKEKVTKQKKVETETTVTEDKAKNIQIRKQLLIGVNEVTKGLEKDEVRLVITCHSAKPAFITKHLIRLSAVRKCPAMCINGLSETVCSVMNLKSAVALGFKKTSEGDPQVFEDLVKFVSEQAVEIDLAWLEQEIKLPSENVTETPKENGKLANEIQSTIEIESKTLSELPSDGIENATKTESKTLGDIIESEKCLPETSAAASVIRDTDDDVSMEINDLDPRIHESSHQISPISEPPKVKDFSHFYVYKDNSKNRKVFSGDFIAFSDNDVQKEVLNGQDVVTVTRVQYKKARTETVPQNINKKEKKTKKKKKKIKS